MVQKIPKQMGGRKNWRLGRILWVVLGISSPVYGQWESSPPPHSPFRYRGAVFDSVIVYSQVWYATAPAWYFPFPDVDLYMDIYMPAGDTLMNRPLIIFAHSGGFLTGNRRVDNMRALCDTFARMGFVTATIDYRKGYNPLSSSSAERAVYRAIQDGKAAVRFFRHYASLYRIDTTRIFFGGASAGGYMALHLAYVDKESERPASSYNWPDLGCLDCAGNSFPNSSEISAAINYWGALGDTLFIETPQDPPAILFHSYYDNIVPYGYDHPFGLTTLPKTYGSGPVAERLANLGILHELYPSTQNAHMLDGSNNGDWDSVTTFPTPFYYDTMISRTSRFLYRYFLKPGTEPVSPIRQSACGMDTVFRVEVLGMHPESFFWWFYDTPSVLLVQGQGQSTAYFSLMTWGPETIAVQEWNRWQAAGDTLYFVLAVYPVPSPEIWVDTLSLDSGIFQLSFWVDSFIKVESVRWSVNGVPVPGLGTPWIAQFSPGGNYWIRVEVTGEGGCTGTAEFFLHVPEGESDTTSPQDSSVLGLWIGRSEQSPEKCAGLEEKLYVQAEGIWTSVPLKGYVVDLSGRRLQNFTCSGDGLCRVDWGSGEFRGEQHLRILTIQTENCTVSGTFLPGMRFLNWK